MSDFAIFSLKIRRIAKLRNSADQDHTNELNGDFKGQPATSDNSAC